MILEFKLYKLKEKSETYKKFLKNNNIPDGLIIVGEKLLSKDYDCYQALQFGEEGDLVLIAGTKIKCLNKNNRRNKYEHSNFNNYSYCSNCCSC